MKVLMINGSPHARGSTYTALHYVEQELNQQGVETEIFHIGSAPVQGCTGCRICRSSSPRRCVFDDSVNLCAEKIAQSDGLVIGSPVHYSGIAGGMKAFCDRLFYLAPDLRYKPLAAVSVLRRSGGVATFDQLNHYLTYTEGFIVTSRYWNVVHGASPEDIPQDEEGVLIMRQLGRNVAYLLHVLNSGKNAVECPEELPRVRTNFVR